MARFKIMINNMTNRMNRDGKFHESPPKNIKGACQVYKYLQGNISEQQLITEIKDMNIFAQDSNEQVLREMELDEMEKKQKKYKAEYLKSIAKPKHQQFSKEF